MLVPQLLELGTGHMNIVLQPTSICNPPSPGPAVCLLKRGHVSTWLIRRPPIEEGNPSPPPQTPQVIEHAFQRMCVYWKCSEVNATKNINPFFLPHPHITPIHFGGLASSPPAPHQNPPKFSHKIRCPYSKGL